MAVRINLRINKMAVRINFTPLRINKMAVKINFTPLIEDHKWCEINPNCHFLDSKFLEEEYVNHGTS